MNKQQIAAFGAAWFLAAPAVWYFFGFGWAALWFAAWFLIQIPMRRQR